MNFPECSYSKITLTEEVLDTLIKLFPVTVDRDSKRRVEMNMKVTRSILMKGNKSCFLTQPIVLDILSGTVLDGKSRLLAIKDSGIVDLEIWVFRIHPGLYGRFKKLRKQYHMLKYGPNASISDVDDIGVYLKLYEDLRAIVESEQRDDVKVNLLGLPNGEALE